METERERLKDIEIERRRKMNRNGWIDRDRLIDK